MGIAESVAPRRGEIEIRADFEEVQAARKTAEILRPAILPSEEAALDRLERTAREEATRLAAERRFLGKLDMAELLKQARPGPAPRWFLYNPLSPCDEIRWCAEGSIVFESHRARRAYDRIPMNLPNPFSARTAFISVPILLPARIRDQVLALYREKIDSYILYEPRLVRSESLPDPKPLPKPDPALVVRAGMEWFIVDLWDDPLAEDPRALGTLREFFVGSRRR